VHNLSFIQPIIIRLSEEKELPIRGLRNKFGKIAYSFDFYGDKCHISDLKNEINLLLTTENVLAYEFSCHIGYVDETLKKVTTYNQNRTREMETLMSEETLNYLTNLNVELCSFANLLK